MNVRVYVSGFSSALTPLRIAEELELEWNIVITWGREGVKDGIEFILLCGWLLTHD